MKTLEFAINLELDGEKYYNEQAAINQGNGLNTVFLILAKEESNHAEILRRKAHGLLDKLPESPHSTIKSVFTGMVDFKMDIKSNPEQVDLYRMALDKEAQSIALYKSLLDDAGEGKELFEYLIQQEKEHHSIIEEIIKLVNRPNEWVESAEFGIREEY